VSLIGILESNCHDGPVFFNCYPDFFMSLKMNTPLKLLNYILKHLKTSLMKNMILLKSFVQTPKKLQHEELIGNIPEEWILEDIVEEDKIENTEIRDIIREGPNIRLRMNSSHSIRIPNYWNKEEISPRHSIDNFVINDEVIGINNNRPHIATSFYGTENNYSPTTSQILGVITKEKPFEIDKNWISKDFYAKYNTGLRKWYFTRYSEKETIEIRKKFYDYLIKNKINLYFFYWLKKFFHDFKKEFCPLTKTTTSWKTSTGQTIESQYPPKETIKLQ
ncbi:hypothetical protein S245_048294, partial [Arachis hypogaea]